MSGFTACLNKGFRIEFENGIEISVQWGVDNYCSRKNDGDWKDPGKSEFWESSTAEVAIFHNNKLIGMDKNGDEQVRGWQSSTEVADLITKCSTARNIDHLHQLLNRK
jgi:hypothetical protein